MSQTIVILLILLVLVCFSTISRILKNTSKESKIKYLKTELQNTIESKSSDNSYALAAFLAFVIEFVIIYYAIQSIISLVK